MERTIASDVAQIYELWNEYAAFCHAGDLERWMTLWTDEGLQLAPDEPPRIRKEQIRAGMQPGFDHFIMSSMVINTEEVRILGAQAYSHGTYTFDVMSKDGGETQSLSGKFLDILEKQADSSWRIAIDCHNYNEPSG
ncbi:MAG TPA: SgcJ/EcaC family oxidoreductase [candidate division Zixibacteria bacterium]|nr:SgcJ/EcaC family oxidoreductase [candidate division Zixibacteria bacterium]